MVYELDANHVAMLCKAAVITMNVVYKLEAKVKLYLYHCCPLCSQFVVCTGKNSVVCESSTQTLKWWQLVWHVTFMLQLMLFFNIYPTAKF